MESLDEMNSAIQSVYNYLNRNNEADINVDLDTKDIHTNFDIIIDRVRTFVEIMKTDSTRSLSTPPLLNELSYLQLSEWAQKLIDDEITYIDWVDPYSGEERYRLQQSFEHKTKQISILMELMKEFNSLMPNLDIKIAKVKKYYDSFDTDDKTNPLIFDIKFINDLHREFDGYLWNTMDIDRFKNCFRIVPKKLIKKDGVTVSAICYFFGLIEYKQTAISNFAEWIEAYHVNGNYGKIKKQFIVMADTASDERNNFSLTVPQQKALATKENIDDRLKRIEKI